jgi:hypothetical protein
VIGTPVAPYKGVTQKAIIQTVTSVVMRQRGLLFSHFAPFGKYTYCLHKGARCSSVNLVNRMHTAEKWNRVRSPTRAIGFPFSHSVWTGLQAIQSPEMQKSLGSKAAGA